MDTASQLTGLFGLGQCVALPEPKAAARAFELTAEEAVSLVRIVAGAVPIRRHYDLFVWLSGELQTFLPHDILISAWGDFAAWRLQLDVVSRVPGLHTQKAARCSEELLRCAHAHWLRGGRQPAVLEGEHLSGPGVTCTCVLHRGWRSARAVLLHGVRDQRSGSESLYVVLSASGFPAARGRTQFEYLAHLLFCQIDIACRQVAPLPLDGAIAAEVSGVQWCDLSAREREIFDCICRGKTNREIAAALEISLFTVKNHLQRIFRKIGVKTRMQAAAKYHKSVRDSETAKRN